MKKIKRLVSGITPSGSELHIANYFGAVKPLIEFQESVEEPYYFVADLHALTTIQNRNQLEKNITGVVLDFLALGLDPEKCVFYRQSDVPENSQLAIVLANYISFGQMKRMHAFKDKLEKGASQDSINMGLFNYPILMAADILAYKADGVPVGEDQRQHVELTRDIADNFNRTYKQEIFPLPEPIISKETGKIVGTDGERKMSKSLGNIIGIFEESEVIKKQIMGCFTDPKRLKATDLGTVEGNPVFVYHDLINDNKEEIEDLKRRYREGKVGDVEVKEKLLAAHQRLFGPMREKRKELVANMDQVREILRTGAEKARRVAEKNLREVYQVIGENNQLNSKGKVMVFNPGDKKPTIAYDDFSKLDMRMAKVIEVEEIEGADKLLKITLDVGPLGQRTVAAGIKQWYKPEDLIGKTVVYLANLEPRQLRGIESQGMIVAAGNNDAILLHPGRDVEAGEIVR